MVELVEAAITIDPVKGGAEKQERGKAEAEPPLAGCVPGKGPVEVGQLF